MTVTLTQSGNFFFSQGSVTALNEVISISRLTTWGNVGIQVTGTWTGTLTFEVSVDGTNFVTLGVTPTAGGAVVTTATANGAWTVQNGGYTTVRARFSTPTSGTPVITLRFASSQV